MFVGNTIEMESTEVHYIHDVLEVFSLEHLLYLSRDSQLKEVGGLS